MLPRPPAPNDELCDKAYEFDDMSGDADSSPYPGSFELSAIDIALNKKQIAVMFFLPVVNNTVISMPNTLQLILNIT